MKNLVLIIGTFLIVFNTLIGLIVSDYATFNYLMADLSLALSTVIIYFVAYSNIVTGAKIGLTVLFFFTGIARCLCIALAPQVWENNFSVIAAAGIFVFELICLVAATFMQKKQNVSH